MIKLKKYIISTDRSHEKDCRNPGLNQGPLDLQSNALPTELGLGEDVLMPGGKEKNEKKKKRRRRKEKKGKERRKRDGK